MRRITYDVKWFDVCYKCKWQTSKTRCKISKWNSGRKLKWTTDKKVKWSWFLSCFQTDKLCHGIKALAETHWITKVFIHFHSVLSAQMIYHKARNSDRLWSPKRDLGIVKIVWNVERKRIWFPKLRDVNCTKRRNKYISFKIDSCLSNTINR